VFDAPPHPQISDQERAAVERLIALVERGGYIEWHREKQFKYAALKRVATIMVGEQARLLGQAPGLRR
jgi:hypothetical protein